MCAHTHTRTLAGFDYVPPIFFYPPLSPLKSFTFFHVSFYLWHIARNQGYLQEKGWGSHLFEQGSPVAAPLRHTILPPSINLQLPTAP